MPTLADYSRLAPFSLEELVDAANSLLRDKPRLQVTARTVRYYIAEGLLPRPDGPPKFARYSAEHLSRLVGLRRLQDEGRRLEEATEELDRREQVHQATATLHRSAEASPLMEPALAAIAVAEPGWRQVRRIQLTPRVALELLGESSGAPELREALTALESLVNNSPTS